MKAILIFAVTALVLAVVTINAPAQDWGCGGPCNTYDALQDYGYSPGPSSAPPPSYNRQSLNNQSYAYGFNSGADYCCDFSERDAQTERIEQRNWRLQNLYQNQKPAACGPAFNPRAREGC